jgi:hypothetical protein
VSSRTPGAAISLDGAPVGATPTVLSVEAHHHHVIVVQGAGGAGSCQLDPSVGGGWVILDIVLGVLPAVIDLVTNAWSTPDQTNCYVPV